MLGDPPPSPEEVVDLFCGPDPELGLAALRARTPSAEAAILDYRLTSIVEHELGADLDALSPLAYDEGEEYGAPDALVAEGLGSVLAALTAGLDVRLDEPVRTIRRDARGVHVETTSGQLDAEHCICTLPLGVLKPGTVFFDPPLPRRTPKGIARLGVGHLEKLILHFERPFWDEQPVMLGHVPADRGHFVERLNLLPLTGAPVLVAFNAGSEARGLAERDDADVVAAGMQALERMYR